MRPRWTRIRVIGIPGGVAAAFVILWLTGPSPVWMADTARDLSLLDPYPATAATGSRTTLTDNLRPYDRTVRVDARWNGAILDPLDLECHGGRASVTWTVGNLEPTIPDTGIHLSARLDGVVIGSILRGSTRGIWNDTPVDLHAVVDCPAGHHRLDLEVTSVVGSWGIPYVVNEDDPPSDRLRVNRGFFVTEIWD